MLKKWKNEGQDRVNCRKDCFPSVFFFFHAVSKCLERMSPYRSTPLLVSIVSFKLHPFSITLVVKLYNLYVYKINDRIFLHKKYIYIFLSLLALQAGNTCLKSQDCWNVCSEYMIKWWFYLLFLILYVHNCLNNIINQ